MAATLTLGGDISAAGALDLDTNVNGITLVGDGDGIITLDTSAGDQRRYCFGGCRWRHGELDA